MDSHPTDQPHHFVKPQERREETEDIMNPETFKPPFVQEDGNCRVVIEFCDRCRWLHRATWTQTELFLTFPDSPEQKGLSSITLMPRNDDATAGRWRVWIWVAGRHDVQGKLIWDRKTEGGFGEMKVLKQRIRDVLLPDKLLGHSDRK